MTMRRLFTVLPGLLVLLGLATASIAPPAASAVPSTTERAHQQVSLSQRQGGTVAGSVTLAFGGDVHFLGRTVLTPARNRISYAALRFRMGQTSLASATRR